MIILFKTRLGAFFNNQNGATAIEYGLMAGALAAVVLLIMPNITVNLSNKFSAIGSSFNGFH
jgi:pilus assembly protein Flp/PilA